jgi:hypothetical protein
LLLQQPNALRSNPTVCQISGESHLRNSSNYSRFILLLLSRHWEATAPAYIPHE